MAKVLEIKNKTIKGKTFIEDANLPVAMRVTPYSLTVNGEFIEQIELYKEDTQSDFQSGTLTDVTATSAGDLELAKATSGADDSYTKLLLHMDGADNGTTFTDECGKTVTRYGAVTKTGVKKFGTASAYFDGTDDFLSLADSEDYNFGSGAFTIDFWFYPTSTPSVYYMLVSKGARGTDGNADFEISFNKDRKIDVYRIGQYYGSIALELNAWHHVAFVRSEDTCKLFVDGSLDGSWNFTGAIYNSTRPLFLGKQEYNAGSPVYYYNGYIDELRISKGIARWTSNFTPPSAPYGAYKTPGTRIKEVDISGANPAGGTKIEWSKTTPTNTAVKVETALSTDGGSTYGAFAEATSGSSIPGITAETDLSNARLKIKETLSTTDTSVTPKLHSLGLYYLPNQVYLKDGNLYGLLDNTLGV